MNRTIQPSNFGGHQVKPERPSPSPWKWVPSAYFTEGLPYVVVMILSVILYKQLGLSNSKITFYTAWLYLPWVLKPFWRPFVGQLMGYRWWALAMELMMALAFGGVAFTIPTPLWQQGSLFFFFLLAFACAFHDVAVDELCRIVLPGDKLVWTVSIRSLFYTLAAIIGQGVLVMIAGNLQVIFRNSISYSWSLLFYVVNGLFLALWIAHYFLLPRRPWAIPSSTSPTVSLADMGRRIVRVLSSWRSLVFVIFVIFYMLPETLLSKVSTLFLLDAGHNGGLGLSPQEYALAQGTVGVLAFWIGSVLGSVAIGREGLRRWMFPMSLIFVVPTIIYVFLSFTLTAGLGIVCLCMFLHQLGYGFGLTAYLQYIIERTDNGNRNSYGWSMSLMAFTQMAVCMGSGYLQESLGYRQFFVIVVSCSLVTLVVTMLAIFTRQRNEQYMEN
jgi:PAT family beta-lactamase induction signal transducer AmpG